MNIQELNGTNKGKVREWGKKILTSKILEMWKQIATKWDHTIIDQETDKRSSLFNLGTLSLSSALIGLQSLDLNNCNKNKIVKKESIANFLLNLIYFLWKKKQSIVRC